jgi:hypothetical protein
MLATRAAAEPLFDAASRAFDAGEGAHFVALADINHDGRFDAVVANYIAPSVSLLEGKSDGSFGSPQPFSAGYSGLTAVAVGDLNHDGRPDFAYSDPSGFVGVRLGTAAGFGNLTTYAVAGDAQWVAFGDLNGDGASDILTANRDPFYSHSVSILEGDGEAGFGRRHDVDFGVGVIINCAVSGDFDEDGRDDIAATGSNGTFVYVRLTSADTSFTVESDFAVGISPTAMAVADVNGDGHLDIVCGGQDRATLLAGNGHGFFIGRTNLPVAGGMPVIADFNADGRPDIAFTGGGSVAVLLADPSGGFRLAQTIVSWSAASAIAAGDVNGDGAVDLVTADNSTSDVSVMLGNGDGSFGTGLTYPLGPFATCAAAGDLDSDGRMDVAVARSDPWVTIMKGQGDGTFAIASTLTLGTYVQNVTIRDLNGDGIPDLVVGGAGATVLLGTGGLAYAPPVTYRADLFTNNLAVGDLNGDGIPDIAGPDPGHWDSGRHPQWIPGTTVHVWYGAGDGSFPVESTYTVGQTPYDLGIADMNGDGRSDLIVANASSSTVTVMLSNSNGGLQSGIAYASISAPVHLAIADLNEDGHPDAVTASEAVSALAVQFTNPDGSLGPPTPIASFDGPQAVSAADLDGDGHIDLVVSAQPVNGVAILRGNGDGTFAARDRYGTGSWPQRVAIADFNGDGAPDLAVPHPVGTISILRNRTARPTSVLISVASVEADPGSVTVSWWIRDVDVSQVRVERSTDAVRWVGIGHPDIVVPGLVQFIDRLVIEGATYEYRLAVGSGPAETKLGETTVRVPIARGLEMAVSPNPVLTTGVITFHLASSEAARLEAWDVTGRRVWSTDVGAMGPGRHAIELPSGGFRAGTYWIRLSQSGVTMMRRFALLR